MSPYDLLTFENAPLMAECPECETMSPSWESTEGDHFVDCPSCDDCFPVLQEDTMPRSLSRIVIHVLNDAVENALSGTIPRNFEPTLSMSLSMMLDNDFFEDQNEERIARHLEAIL